ncbi:MAG: NUDIX hydrolase [Phototrophicaceae bacterium]
MAKFCPECGSATIKYDVFGRMRDVCPDGHFVQYAEYHNSVAALAFRGNSVLLVQHNHDTKPWSLPGGYIEQEEDLALGLKREVIEESNIEIKPIGIVAIRNLVKETRNELYIIFLCDVDDEQVPSSNDPEEIIDAQFIPLEKLNQWNITPFTLRVIQGYLANKPDPMKVFHIDGYHPNAFMFGNV